MGDRVDRDGARDHGSPTLAADGTGGGSRRQARRIAALAVVAAAGVGSLLTAGAAGAAGRAPGRGHHGRAVRSSATGWQSYVEGTSASKLTPVSVTSTTGSVTNPGALVGGSGVTTLTYIAGQTPPTIVLDYGEDVGGLPYFNIGTAVPGFAKPSVTLKAGYSETQRYLFGSGPSTTLTAAAAAGATQVSVTSATGLVVGRPLIVDTGDTQETVTITSVGPAGGSSGTTVSFTPALSSPHAAGATVSTPSPTNITGDAISNAGLQSNGTRTDSFSLTPASNGTTVEDPANDVQGAERFEAIQLTTPGRVTLTGAGIVPEFNDAGASAYNGDFLSSDPVLNQIWYAGAYTAQLDMSPAGTTCISGGVCSTTPVVLDGAKRDRRPWTADLYIEGPTIYDSLGFGDSGSTYVKDTIADFGSSPLSNGSVCGRINTWLVSPAACLYYSPTFSIYYVLTLADYYLYSGDSAFAESQFPVLAGELAFNAKPVSLTGLSTASGPDWDYHDGSKGGLASAGGAVAATNMLSYAALADGAWLASELAAADPTNSSAPTWTADASAWSSRAAALKAAINKYLFNSSLGAYQLSTSNDGTHAATAVPEDANAQAILFGVAPGSADSSILSNLQTLWGPFGPDPFSAAANYSTTISPFVAGLELGARFVAGDAGDAISLAHLLWGQMVQTSGPFYSGGLWENLDPNGQDSASNTSLAHGWATAPVSAFSSYLLGIRPTGPGYSTWEIAPQPGTLAWAQGQVPTPGGPIASSWQVGAGDSSFSLTMAAPAGTSGSVAIPELGTSPTITEDGQTVWSNGAPVNGAVAAQSNGAIVFSGISGAHTFAWN